MKYRMSEGFDPHTDVLREMLKDAGSPPADLGYGTHPAPSENEKRGAHPHHPSDSADMKYVLVTSSEGGEFAATVESLLRQGYELVGGVSIAYDTYTTRDDRIESTVTYAQALIKK